MSFVGGGCLGAPEGLTGSGSGFKVSQKARPGFKILSYILGEPGMEVTTLGHKESILWSLIIHYIT